MKKTVCLALFTFLMILSQTGCMLTYLAKSGYSQLKLLSQRESIDQIIDKKKYDEKTIEKLKLVQLVHDFCHKELKLKPTKNYKSFVQLEDDYVSYLLRVAPKYELKSHDWWFPIVGSFPYLGFFNKQDALNEKKKFDEKGFDTYVRGVSAFSTLGWFKDPILSSMLLYDNYNLVNTVIHETVHATLFIKNQADFNERMATFLGNVGAEIFYKKFEGPDSKTLAQAIGENNDDKIFSKFISKELEDLKEWYRDTKHHTPEQKTSRLAQINQRFTENILGTLQTDRYKGFAKKNLNNANLLPYLTYLSDLSDFEKIYDLLGRDYAKTLEYFKTLEKVDDPMASLKLKIKNFNSDNNN